MDSKHITVVYKWTANEGKLDELTSIYKDVTTAMEQNEPGAETVHVYVSEAENALYVRDEFVDADAVGFHLGTTAGAHSPSCWPLPRPAPSSSWATCRPRCRRPPSRCSSAASSPPTSPASIAERARPPLALVVGERRRRHLPPSRVIGGGALG